MKCTKLCSEPCNRALCDHQSDQLLPECNHPSIGICGEENPGLCRVCDKNEVQTIFLGYEDEIDARFIKLEDCQHVIEVKGLLEWMNTENDSNSHSNATIKLKTCPKCKTIIRKTASLNTFTQPSFRDIQKVKLKTWGSTEDNIQTQRNLFESVREIVRQQFGSDSFQLKSIYEGISRETMLDEGEHKCKSKQALMELSNKLKLTNRLHKICTTFCESQKKSQNVSKNTIESFELRLGMAIEFVRKYKNSEQQRLDISTEIPFLEIMNKVIVEASGKPSNTTAQTSIDQAFEEANSYGAVTASIRNKFQKIVSAALPKFTRIGISLKEKEMVLDAMGLTRGHWYKCKNGHVYAIGDCGGATEESKCPECGQAIGGTQHRLRDDNALATEMDGASVPAWPT